MEFVRTIVWLHFFMQISEGLEFTSSSLNVPSCESKNTSITWEYRLDTGESILSTQWRKNSTSGLVTIANYFGGIFMATANYTGRLERIGNAGLNLIKSTSSDAGKYYVFVTLTSGNTHNASATIKMHEIPNNSCKPFRANEDSRRTHIYNISKECPGRNEIQAIWEGGFISVFTCPQKSENYKCCAQGDPVTYCYLNPNDLCINVACEDDNNIATIIGGVVGGVAGLVCAAVGGKLIHNRYKKRNRNRHTGTKQACDNKNERTNNHQKKKVTESKTDSKNQNNEDCIKSGESETKTGNS